MHVDGRGGISEVEAITKTEISEIISEITQGIFDAGGIVSVCRLDLGSYIILRLSVQVLSGGVDCAEAEITEAIVVVCIITKEVVITTENIAQVVSGTILIV